MNFRSGRKIFSIQIKETYRSRKLLLESINNTWTWSLLGLTINCISFLTQGNENGHSSMSRSDKFQQFVEKSYNYSPLTLPGAINQKNGSSFGYR